MKRLAQVLPFVALSLLLACKLPQHTSGQEQSITAKGKAAGKWLATISIGGDVSREDTLYLADVLKKNFLSTRGGGYTSAFHLVDNEVTFPSKDLIRRSFVELKETIASYRAAHPSAPTMVVIGLTGHGFSSNAVPFTGESFSMVIDKSDRGYQNPQSTMSGRELAEWIGELAADETLVFVQSCLSGNLTKVEFVSKYAQALADEATRRRTNIAVITPVSELITTPFRGIEPLIENSLNDASAGGDFITYAHFKDALVRRVCEHPGYYPSSSIADPSAIGPSLLLGYGELATGLDPQFFENIRPNLPLMLTPTGLQKWYSSTLPFPPSAPVSQAVPVSERTQKICLEKQKKNSVRFQNDNAARASLKQIFKSCEKESDFRSCAEQKLKGIRNP